MKRGNGWRLDGAPVTAAIEIERFSGFDHATRRFIAYALSLNPELAAYVGNPPTVADNAPAPFLISLEEEDERRAAYAAIPEIRACCATGVLGQRLRRQHFAELLAIAKVDLKWKRLRTRAALIFCYERLVGAEWRELLIPCWKEAVFQRRKRGPVQLPLDYRLRDDSAVPNMLEDDQPPVFYPSMADADSFESPLLVGL